MTYADTQTDALFEQAAAWLSRLDGADRKDQSAAWSDPEFLDWMARSEQHRLAFAEASQIWFDSAQVNPRPTVQPVLDAAAVPTRSRTGAWQAAGLTLLLLAAALIPDWGWLWLRAQSDLAVPRGGVATTTLADGSKVQLAGDSAVRWLRDGRGLELLRGSVVLDVTEDPANPFRVLTGDLEVQVLGTRFGVFNRGDTRRVGVLSGVVQVSAEGQLRQLTAGQQIWNTDGQLVTDPMSPQEFFSWADGRLVVRGGSLADVVARLQPFSDRRIWLQGSRPQVRLDAVLALDDTDRALATVAQEAGLELTTAGPLYILR